MFARLGLAPGGGAQQITVPCKLMSEDPEFQNVAGQITISVRREADQSLILEIVSVSLTNGANARVDRPTNRRPPVGYPTAQGTWVSPVGAVWLTSQAWSCADCPGVFIVTEDAAGEHGARLWIVDPREPGAPIWL